MNLLAALPSPSSSEAEVNTNNAPVVNIVSPTNASMVTGLVVVQVDASDVEDALGTLNVEVSTDGGVSWNRAYWTIGTFYEYRWETPTATEDMKYTLIARAADSSAKRTESASIPVIVDNIETGSLAHPAKDSNG